MKDLVAAYLQLLFILGVSLYTGNTTIDSRGMHISRPLIAFFTLLVLAGVSYYQYTRGLQ